jgi:hypothetical protein
MGHLAPTPPRFIDVEDEKGNSLSVGDCPRMSGGALFERRSPEPRSWEPPTEIGTVRCARCGWSFEGEIPEGISRAAAHRAKKHPDLPSNRRRTSANGGGANPARSRRARRALGEREKAERHRAIRAAMDELQAEGRETATTTEILERVKSEFEMTPTGVGLTLGNAGY